ncbi:MAG: hypothetical protein AAF797_00740 [Planctomycetota bacterium]
MLIWLDEQRSEASHLIYDQDTKFAPGFDQRLHAAGVRVVYLA